MAMRDSELLHIIQTDFGVVRLSPETLVYLSSIDPRWREITTSKRFRSRHANWVREKVREVESAAMTMAAIKWESGKVLAQL